MSQVKSDLEIAFESEMKKITEIADNLNLFDEEVENYGHYKAKLSLSILDRLKKK